MNNNGQHYAVFTGKVEKRRIVLWWWRVTSKVEDWYYDTIDFIDYIKRYKKD